MVNRIRIYSYNNGEGSKNLSEATGYPRLRHEGSTFRPREGDVVVNWGCSTLPIMSPARVINNPYNIRIASDKLQFLTRMSSEGLDIVPEWTTDGQIAFGWLKEGHTVVLRHKLTGHSGEGIEICSGPPEAYGEASQFDHCPLYTKYFKKKHEYRVHVVNSRIIDIQQKKRKTDVPDSEVNWKVRNLAGGFIYARQDIDVPERVREVALLSHEASGLDFGAYDILWNDTSKKAVVLEVNTAPGITGTTVTKYREAFAEMLNNPTENEITS